MHWSEEAVAALKKVPFFVRKRVRARVEKEAAAAGQTSVSIEDLKAAQKRFLAGMASEIKGYRLEACFGPSGCPNRATASDRLLEKLEALLQQENLLGFLKKQVKGELKFHHEFRIGVADCPNGCSQPQIKDIGIIGACVPAVTDKECSRCEACTEACQEGAVAPATPDGLTLVAPGKCLGCGRCPALCPTGTIVAGQKGYRVQLGGRLGRHPQLARELPGIFSKDQIVAVVKYCIEFYKEHSTDGKRFADIFSASDFENLARRCRRKNFDLAGKPRPSGG